MHYTKNKLEIVGCKIMGQHAQARDSHCLNGGWHDEIRSSVISKKGDDGSPRWQNVLLGIEMQIQPNAKHFVHLPLRSYE